MADGDPFKSVVPDDAVSSSEADLSKIDTSVAHPARIYDYWLGGKDNFAADREAGELVIASRPGLRESDIDLRDTGKLLARAADTLDFTQPIAVMLLGVLHLISDDEDPWRIVATIMDAVPSGSYLVITHPASDLLPETQREASRRYNQNVATHQTLRSYDEVARFFDGLEVLEPGLVQWHLWRPNPDDAAPAEFKSGHCGVARKP